MSHSVLQTLACLALLVTSGAQVIISQVGEGSGVAKFAVIQNRGSAAVAMANWELSEKSNVDTAQSPTTVRKTWAAGASLGAGATITLCNTGSFSAPFTTTFCDEEIAIRVNGNDALILTLPDGSVVDQFGDLDGASLQSTSPVTTWTIGCTPSASKNHMVLRRSGAAAVSTNAAWAASSDSDWDVYPLDTYMTNGAIYSTADAVAKPDAAALNDCPGVTASPLGGSSIVPGETLPSATTAPVTTTAIPTSGAVNPALDGSKEDIGRAVGNTDCAAPQQQEDRRSDMNRLVIATFNTEFLFDGVNDPAPSRFKGDAPGAQAHVLAVAKSITDWDVDIINLVEVEDCSIMSTLVSELDKVSPAFSGYIMTGSDSATGQDVALLTKIDPSEPLTRSKDRADYPVAGSQCGFTEQRDTAISKNYIAKFNDLVLGDKTLNIAMVGLHYKAFPTDKASCAQREGQATIARALLDDLWNQGYEVIALGDFNDFDADIPDAMDSKPNSKVLSIMKGPENDMFNTMESIPKAERFTSWYDKNRNNQDGGAAGGENSMIDHILVSAGIRELITDVTIDHSEATSTGLSDHWPIIITLRSEGTADGGLPRDVAAASSVFLPAITLLTCCLFALL